MRPDFALDFRDNKISLLHRAENAWVRLGQVDMTDPDLDAALAYLRATALGLSPRGIASQLIVPNDLILYTRLDGLSQDPAQRAAQIGDGLAGRTPYDLADLVFDWAGEGDTAQVAVVARETLTEAEEFATQHRFNPVSFAAWPAMGDFDGEVWFGTTATSQSLLSAGEVVERDASRSFVIMPEGAHRTPVSAQDFEMGQKPQIEDAAQEAPPEAAPLAVPPDLPPIEAPAITSDGDISPQMNWAEHLPQPLATAEVPQMLPVQAEQTPEATTIQPEPIPQELVPETVPHTDLATAPPQPLETVPQEIVPQDNGPQETLPQDEGPLNKGPQNLGPQTASFDAAYDALSSSHNMDTPDEAPMAVDVPISDDLPAQDAPQGAALGEDAGAAAMRTPKLGPALAAGTKGSAPLGADKGDAVAGLKKQIARPGVVKHVPAILPPNGKQNLGAITKAKPKSSLGLGWILTILLLIALVAVAALSQVFLETSASTGADSGAPQAATDVSPDKTAASLPDAEANASASASASASSNVVANQPNLDKTLTQAAQPLTTSEKTLLQDINLAKLPPLPKLAGFAPDLTPKALAQQPALVQAAPAQQIAPAPRSMVLPSQAVAQRADIAPPLSAVYADPLLANARPAPRPITAQPQAQAQDPAGSTIASAIGLRPAPRPLAGDDLARASRLASAPASLVASAALDASENQLLGLGAISPLPSLVSVPEARDLSQIRPLQRQESGNLGAAGLEANLPAQNPLALAISPRPAVRPKGLAAAFAQRQIDAAVAAAALVPEPSSTLQANAQITSPAVTDDTANAEAMGNEEVTRDNGGAGTRSIVTKQSTLKNAMNLSQVNLVGIFGSNANRYALIRRANGTFKKLKVGDRFDGGRVAAITETEVRYDKGGDLVALTLPNG